MVTKTKKQGQGLLYRSFSTSEYIKLLKVNQKTLLSKLTVEELKNVCAILQIDCEKEQVGNVATMLGKESVKFRQLTRDELIIKIEKEMNKIPNLMTRLFFGFISWFTGMWQSVYTIYNSDSLRKVFTHAKQLTVETVYFIYNLGIFIFTVVPLIPAINTFNLNISDSRKVSQLDSLFKNVIEREFQQIQKDIPTAPVAPKQATPAVPTPTDPVAVPTPVAPVAPKKATQKKPMSVKKYSLRPRKPVIYKVGGAGYTFDLQKNIMGLPEVDIYDNRL
jgi:hypothetical protein